MPAEPVPVVKVSQFKEAEAQSSKRKAKGPGHVLKPKA